MHLIRRSAFRAINSRSTFIPKSRTLATSSPFLLRSKKQAIVAPVFRRFASDDGVTENDYQTGRQEEQSSSSISSSFSTDRSENDYQTERHEEQSTSSNSSLSSEEKPSFSRAVESADDADIDYPSDSFTTAEKPKDTLVNIAQDIIQDAAAVASSFAPRERRREPYSGDRNSAGRNVSGSFASDQVLEPSPGIYIGNLIFDLTEDELARIFAEYGNIKSVKIATDARGLSKGFGYISFENVEQANAAIRARDQSVLEGRRIVVNFQARPTRPTAPQNPPSKTVFVGNLAFEMSDADLNKLFRDIKNVIDVRVAIDRRTGQPRGFAHADFVDVESAIKGHAALANKEVYGRKLRVDFSGATTKYRTEGGSGRGRDSEEKGSAY